ncbi:MAG: type II secretion system F family protein [Burkholderiaceae bacterium]
MATFSIKALQGAGAIVQLRVEASDAQQALLNAAAQGLAVISIKPRFPLAARFGGKRAGFALELFIQELVSLLAAGLSLVESVDLLADKEAGRAAATVLGAVRADLHRGMNFSDALERQGATFPPLFVASVRAAERTGDIREAMARFLDYRQQIDRVRRKVVSASIYPLTLMAVGALVSAFMLFYVVPKFSRIYEEIGSQLPFLTRALVGWGQLLEDHALAVLLALLLLLGAAALLLTRPAVHAWIGPRLWRVPAIGERLRTYELGRFYRTLAMLLKSGIALPSALDMAGTLLSPLLRQALARAAREIREGQAISRAFETQRLTTQVSKRLLVVGEQTGRMPDMVERIALFHEDELARWVEWFTRLFEPALMVLVGALVGLIVVLLYLPIFELAENVK